MGGPDWVPSDENLKQNIEEVTDASSILAHLVTREYEFNGSQCPFLAFNTGRHIGFMAQDLEQVLPEAVREVTRPADLDEEGNVLVPEATFKAVNYEALLPLVIASNNEQEVRIARLEEQLAACCALGTTDSRSQQQPATASESNSLRTERLLIQPNPIADQTLVRYYIAKEGRARLEVSAEDGRQLDVLREERTTVGEHSYDWNTSSMVPGSYFVALIVDGNVIVKKVVKVGER